MVRNLALPDGVNDAVWWDTVADGLGRRLRRGGAARWVIQYEHNKETQRVTLDGGLSVAQARTAAAETRAKAQLGASVIEEKRKAVEEKAKAEAAAKAEAERIAAIETIGDLVPDYLAFKQPGMKARSYIEIERHIAEHANSIHNMDIEHLDHERIADLLAEIATDHPVLANCVRSTLADFGRWLQRRKGAKKVPINVFAFTLRAETNGARQREPRIDELAMIWQACVALGDDYCDICRLLMLTGLRWSMVNGLRWADVDLKAGTITIPPDREGTKVKATKLKKGEARPFVVPLPQPAIDILKARPRDRDTIFGSGSRISRTEFKARLNQRIAWLAAQRGVAEPEHWTPHDFRRSIRTALSDVFKTDDRVAETILGHVVGGTEGAYNRASYLDQRRTALNLWAEHLMAAIEGCDAKVAPIDRAAA